MSSHSKYSALLIDDDALCNFLNSTVVTDSDSFNLPIVFSDPQKALDYIGQDCLRANQPLPDLVLIDINMPVLDGFELVEKLKELGSDALDKTLLCFLSSSMNVKDKIRAKTLGVDCYYEKPLKAEHLKEIATTLKRRFQGE